MACRCRCGCCRFISGDEAGWDADVVGHAYEYVSMAPAEPDFGQVDYSRFPKTAMNQFHGVHDGQTLAQFNQTNIAIRRFGGRDRWLVGAAAGVADLSAVMRRV